MRFRSEEPGLTFDDVLLEPQYTEIHSRKDVSLVTRVTKNINIEIPFISSNMDTVTEFEMMKAMNDVGGLGILHRFISDDKILQNIQYAMEAGVNPIAFSIGISNEYKSLLNKVKELDPSNSFKKIVTIDVAHGACDRVVDAIKYVKQEFSWDVIAGNVATGETANILCRAGADALKVGIGNGGMCITRKIAGAGVPLLTSLADCHEAARFHRVPIICDGGVRDSGDAVKALAAGAESIITGSLLSGSIETPGKITTKSDGSRVKLYRGMASQSAMDDWRGDSYKDVAAEGESTFVPVKGNAGDIIMSICAGIRSGMTYSDARNLEQLRANAIFVRNTPLGFGENGAHLLGRK